MRGRQTYALLKDVDKLHIRKLRRSWRSYRYISKKVAEMTNGRPARSSCATSVQRIPVRHRDNQQVDTTMGLSAARQRHDRHPLQFHRPGYRVLPQRGRLHLRRSRRDDEQEVRPFGCDRRQDQRLPQRRGLAAAGDPEAQLAFDMFVYKIAAKAAEMATSMCGMDTHSLPPASASTLSAVRAGVARPSGLYGDVKMDHARNALRVDGALGACLPRIQG